MKWAREVLDWSLGQTALMIKEHASNSYIEGEIKKVLKIIKQAGAKGITHSQLTRKCQKIPKQTRDNVLQTLLESEQIIAESTPKTNGGQPKITYRATK